MKKHWTWLIVTTAACAASYAVARSGLIERLGLYHHAGPSLVAPRYIDLGRHETDVLAEAAFGVRNRGASPLRIEALQTNCSCQGVYLLDPTGRRARVESFSVEAGGSVELRMPFTVQGYAGVPNARFIRFKTNDPDNPDVQIDIVVTPFPKCVAVPANLIFGNIALGKRVSSEIQLRATDSYPQWTVGRISSRPPDRVKVEVLPLDRGSRPDPSPAFGPVVGRLRVTVTAERVETVDGDISVFAKGREIPLVKIPVKAVVAHAVALYPGQISLPRASGPGPVYQATCLCRAAHSAPLMLSVAKTPPGVAAKVLDVEGAPGQKAILIDCEQLRKAANGTGGHYRIAFKAQQGGQTYPLSLKLWLRPAPSLR